MTVFLLFFANAGYYFAAITEKPFSNIARAIKNWRAWHAERLLTIHAELEKGGKFQRAENW